MQGAGRSRRGASCRTYACTTPRSAPADAEDRLASAFVDGVDLETAARTVKSLIVSPCELSIRRRDDRIFLLD
jgi:hypothetical protein